MILVDTNVVVDILGNDPDWAAWSTAAFERAAASDTLAINDIVCAELSAGYGRAEELEADLARLALPLVRLPREALFLAGLAFRRYRALRGSKSNMLADFFIGAHAAVARSAVLTRDNRRIRTYFPTVSTISPP
jgi:predicted nucleic acid-binding protein